MKTAALALLMSACSAYAAPSVFGFQMGAPIAQIPECAYAWDGFVKRYKTPAAPCLQQLGAVQDRPLEPGSDILLLFFAPGDWPEIAYGPIDVTVVDGNLALLSVTTGAIGDQERVFAALVKKFGRATDKASRPAQNGFGAQFHVITATWRLKGLRVDFWGAYGSTEHGKVLIGTPAGFQAYEAANTLPRGRPL